MKALLCSTENVDEALFALENRDEIDLVRVSTSSTGLHHTFRNDNNEIMLNVMETSQVIDVIDFHIGSVGM